MPTIFEDIGESVGDAIEAIGGGIVPGERRGRTIQLNLPAHGTPDDIDPYSEGFKMRRQLRSLMENARARLQGIYFRFGIDPRTELLACGRSRRAPLCAGRTDAGRVHAHADRGIPGGIDADASAGAPSRAPRSAPLDDLARLSRHGLLDRLRRHSRHLGRLSADRGDRCHRRWPQGLSAHRAARFGGGPPSRPDRDARARRGDLVRAAGAPDAQLRRRDHLRPSWHLASERQPDRQSRLRVRHHRLDPGVGGGALENDLAAAHRRRCSSSRLHFHERRDLLRVLGPDHR